MIKKLFKNNRGDTIVEVALALTVLALVLGTSSVLANRNTKTLQNAQEKNIAVRYAQQQIEFLKARSQSNMTALTSLPASAKFCMVNADTDPVVANDAACSITNGGATYNQAIVLSPVDGETDIYNAKATVGWETLTSWTDASGNLQNKGNVQLTYRIYSKLGAKSDPNVSDCDSGFVRYPSVSGNPCGPAPTVDLTVQATASDPRLKQVSVFNGRSVHIIWRTQHVSSCQATATPANGGWQGAKTPNIEAGLSVIPANNTTTTFRITCMGNHGSSLQSQVTVTTKEAPPQRTPLYRCYQFWHGTADYRAHTNHHYSTNRSFCDGNGYGSGAYEGVAGYVPLSTNPGVVPVYAAYSGSNSNPAYYDTFFTTSYWEYSSVALPNAHNNAGGVVFYVYPYNNGCSVPGTSPMYRYWSDFVGNHFYTLNPNENPNWFAPHDGGGTFQWETPLGCIFNSGG